MPQLPVRRLNLKATNTTETATYVPTHLIADLAHQRDGIKSPLILLHNSALLWSPNLQEWVPAAQVYGVVPLNPVQVDNVLEIPAYEHVGAVHRRRGDMLRVHALR